MIPESKCWVERLQSSVLSTSTHKKSKIMFEPQKTALFYLWHDVSGKGQCTGSQNHMISVCSHRQHSKLEEDLKNKKENAFCHNATEEIRE